MKLVQRIEIPLLRKSDLNEAQKKRALELIVKRVTLKAKDRVIRDIHTGGIDDEDILLNFAADIQWAVEKFHELNQVFFADTLEEYMYKDGDIIE